MTSHSTNGAIDFAQRHIGPDTADQALMLKTLGMPSRQAFIEAIVPASIARKSPLKLPPVLDEPAALNELKAIANQNKVLKSFIGQGYYGTHTPAVILRNVLENPSWYTAYTPYQAEISQGRLEALINFQTMICDLTGLAIANASMLDEATAAAEAMTLAFRSGSNDSNIFYVDDQVLPQTLAVIRTRAEPLGIEVRSCTGDLAVMEKSFAVLIQYPGVNGQIRDDLTFISAYKVTGGQVIMAADILALTLLTSPGELGADIALGSTQRFGMPMANGGPHAAYLACRDSLKRNMPGRLIGISIDAHGNSAYRLALQTREQHIRREKATSNICTAQVLPAIVASMYVVYHGPSGLKNIAASIAHRTAVLKQGLVQLGVNVLNTSAFDTLHIAPKDTQKLIQSSLKQGMNVRVIDSNHIGISLDETTTNDDVVALWRCFGDTALDFSRVEKLVSDNLIPPTLRRKSSYLTHTVFNRYHSETAMLRYLRALSDKDLALDRSMIPLGSCTMKLNATSEMIPITWPQFAHIHPFAPEDQRAGYVLLDAQLRDYLCQITGYAGISLQPNAGSQGEYAGLLTIRAYHRAHGQDQRTICLIPSSAHGTNPASAQMVGMQVVVTACDAAGNIDMNDLRQKCEEHSTQLAAVMVTYPSTHGVFETQITELCDLVHQHGGRVYIDGANMNALVGLAAPGAFGGDVSHLNLHKTFCIPHGGGGPGVGPVCVAADLLPYLPEMQNGIGAISAAPLGNASVLPITWMYCRMMGDAGLTHATEVAILSANYISTRLKDYYPTLYASAQGHVAHECILDLRPLKDSSGVSAEDVAKRLIDYGFHAPTLSFPVAGTLMVEPTESEPLSELNRFIDAMISIRAEIAQIEQGQWSKDDNPLKNAPHTAASLLGDSWAHPYSRTLAGLPNGDKTYWPPVGRVDNVYGDRNLFCSCSS